MSGSTSSIPSPCIKYCVLSEAKVCQGCFRNINEIAAWSQLTDRSKLQVLAHAAERAKHVAATVAP